MKKLCLEKIACIVVMSCAVSGVAAFAQTFTSLARFNGGNGFPPNGPLAQGFNGDFYGTTEFGGYGIGGTVFTMTPSGSLTTLRWFYPGTEPVAGLVLGTDGNFYGTVSAGAVLKVYPDGGLVRLHYFCCSNGVNVPVAALVQGTDGDFYGTTSVYGNAIENVCGFGCGTVFKITANGKFTSLYSFCSQPSCADGATPVAALIQATDGNFYGTTSAGGAGNVGTVFKITPTGELTTLYSFCSLPNCADGDSPQSPVIQASDGNFYGTTLGGGANSGGTVFEITPAGKLTTLYSFCSQTGCTDGSSPYAGLLQATDGNFYGTTEVGGAYSSDFCNSGCGTVFQITLTGTLTTLHSFCAQLDSGGECSDGSLPVASVVQATHGLIYGTTSSGGFGPSNGPYTGPDAGLGTAFALSVGLGPFIETVGTAGEVGGTVTILGNDLGRTSSVAFNGTAAAFTVVSSTEITATVPTGATTGFVTVTTPIATLTSNKKFRVEP
jgi:uncharacterized repeat protein (TIGR03803 family)